MVPLVMASPTRLAILLPSLMSLFLLPLPAGAEEGQPPAPGAAPPPRYEQLTGGWGETRAVLEQRGVSVGATLTFDVSRVHAHGNATDLVGRALVDANTTLDLGPLLGLPGATAFIQYYGKFGGNGSDSAGDLQGFSNIDAASFNGLGEAWLEVTLLDDVLRLKGGRIDANTEFAALHSSEQFLNSSMGFSPTIWGMPTYPNPGNGALAGVSSGEHFEVTVGAFERMQSVDGKRQRMGWMYLAQARTKWTAPGQRDGSLSVGAWHHTGDVEQVDGSTSRGATGPFATFEQTVWRERGRDVGDETSRHAHVFLQYGKANALLSEVTSHVGAGMAYRAPWGPRRDDLLGFGVTRVGLSKYVEGAPDAYELMIGPFYQFQLTSAIMLQPDVQWLRQVRPGEPTRSGVLGTCRVVVEF